MLREGSVIVAKCAKCKQMFGITMERINGVWHCVWAFKLSESSANAEGYGDELVSGTMTLDPEYPGCPYCGNDGWMKCGACEKVTCYGEDGTGMATCAWCGNSGRSQATESFDLRGGGL